MNEIEQWTFWRKGAIVLCYFIAATLVVLGIMGYGTDQRIRQAELDRIAAEDGQRKAILESTEAAKSLVNWHHDEIVRRLKAIEAKLP